MVSQNIMQSLSLSDTLNQKQKNTSGLITEDKHSPAVL